MWWYINLNYLIKFKEYIIKRYWKLFNYKNVDMLEWFNIAYKYDLFCILYRVDFNKALLYSALLSNYFIDAHENLVAWFSCEFGS